jgi:hypothetical protein
MPIRPIGEHLPVPAPEEAAGDREARAAPAARASEVPDEPKFATVLHALARESDRGESLVQRALSGSRGGGDLGPGELLALQAGIYRYGHVVDLATKLVDRAATDVKTVLQGQS